MSLSKGMRSPKDFWKIYKSLTKVTSSLLSNLTGGLTTASSPVEKVNMLNQFFSSCFGPSTLSDETNSSIVAHSMLTDSPKHIYLTVGTG